MNEKELCSVIMGLVNVMITQKKEEILILKEYKEKINKVFEREESRSKTEDIDPFKTTMTSEEMKNAIAVMLAHEPRPLSLSRIAKRCGLSVGIISECLNKSEWFEKMGVPHHEVYILTIEGRRNMREDI